MPEVREELKSVARNGRISLQTAWRREEGIVSRGQVVAWLDVIILLTSSEVRGINWVKTEERMGGGRMEAGIKEELMSFTFCVGNEVISSEAGRRWRGGRVEEGREQGKQFPRV